MCIEFNLDASGPFLPTRVKECFDFHAVFMHCHDLLSSQPAPEDVRVIQNSATVTQQQQQQERQLQVKNSTGAFRIGLPESQLKAALKDPGAAIRFVPAPLQRPAFILFEKHIYLRSQINIVALEGPLRFVRYWSQARWLRLLRKKGFVTSPLLPLVTQQVKRMLTNLPYCIGLSGTDNGMTLTVCGCDAIHMSLWTVEA